MFGTHLRSTEPEDARLRDLLHCLRHCGDKQRREAAKALPEYGALGFEAACEALKDRDTEVRALAAQALRGHGDAALEPLCEALHDKAIEVRARAAESLGEIGDPRALQPLMAALPRCFVRRSARVQLRQGIAVLVAAIVFFVLLMWGAAALRIGSGFAAVNIIIQSLLGYYRGVRLQNRACLAITEALAKLAETDARPELRQVLPDLKAIAADALQQDRKTRRASRDAAARIESLTERLRSLPVAAPAPAADTTRLPAPAAAPERHPEDLPRITGI